MIPRHEVLGVPTDEVDIEGALAFVEGVVALGSTPRCIMAVNPEKVIALKKDPWLLQFFRRADLLIPDGIGVVWALGLLHGVRVQRVPGADLMQSICALAAKKGWGIFLYGALEEVNAEAAAELVRRYPGLRVAGRANGYLSEEEAASLPRWINESGARILFVALGSTKQERWIADRSPELAVNIIQAIGGTLDTISGRVQRAPVLFRRLNLEWFYRLLADPRRIRRQALLPGFICRVLVERIQGGRG